MTAASRAQPCSPVSPNARRPAERAALQALVLEVLACNDTSSTAAVRDALNHPDTSGQHVVIEQVYASLVALEHKGLVRRSTNAAGTRPLWELCSPECPPPTPRSHTMPSTVTATVTAPAALADVPTPATIEDRLARIDSVGQAHRLAEVVLEKWDSGVWQQWRPVAAAPLAGWLYTASRHDVSERVDWILRGLAHRAHWVRAARYVEHDRQLHDSLRSVARLDDRQFADVGWTLVLALLPWSACAGNQPSPPFTEAR
ncbi:hypothetical protein [Mycobacterium sp. AT1]|uniref:hypothetical protein n=1 Tax=Mycobacterium sp. AT1 TaxID=1961706 RepID=UPI0009AD67A3|nr:hypothetical protein [Mycobacterium sp. AT1]OPX07374.1 hypothetical protein B1790_23685 [Mycobacterium sp. AT1]